MISCNICGSVEFVDVNKRTKVLCKECGSYERTRLMKLELDRLFPISTRKSLRCLHIAPERGLSAAISDTFGEYVPADIDLDRYKTISNVRFLDLCKKSTITALGYFDVIIHAHVIEHIPCNYAASLLRINNQLTEKGLQLFCIPIYGMGYQESLVELDGAEREKLFGQFDHVRRFSPKDLNFTLGAVFTLPELSSYKAHYDEQTLRSYNIPVKVFDAWNGDVVFSFGRADVAV